MKFEDHMKAFREHRDAVDWAINRGPERSQRIIGAHASRAVVELLSAYLHRINRINPGFQLNHRWFRSAKAGDKLPEFPKKAFIVGKMVGLETESENITYGSQKSEGEIKAVIKALNELEALLKEMIGNEK